MEKEEPRETFVVRRKVGGVWWYITPRHAYRGYKLWQRSPYKAFRYKHSSAVDRELRDYAGAVALPFMEALLTDPEGLAWAREHGELGDD